jgi:hypothetical protein
MLDLESKSSIVTRRLAEVLIGVNVGDQMPTTQDFAKMVEVGFGTVEKAITFLKASKAIETRARGQMGTFLISKDVRALWRIGNLGTLIGLIPLPHAITFMGLATGATAWLEKSGVPFSLNFKNGAQSRLSALCEKRADFIVLSKRSAEMACQSDDSLEPLFELPRGSYYSGHEIVFRSGLKKPRSEWIIGVDSTSFDHVALCDEVFPDSPRQEVHYLNLPYAIDDGRIDASLLHSRSLVPIDLAGRLSSEPLSETDAVLTEASAAVFMTRNDHVAVQTLFAETKGAAEMIHAIQNKVIHGSKVPEY